MVLYWYITQVLLDTWKFEAHFFKFCLLLLEILTEIFEIWHHRSFAFCYIETFLGSRNLYFSRFSSVWKFYIWTINGALQLTRWNCIGKISKRPHLLTHSNCSHSECVHIIWYQTRNGLYYATSCYILYTTTTYGPILHKVVGDCSTSIEVLNLTPGDSYSGGVH